MKSNYERVQYRKKYWLVSGIGLLVLIFWNIFAVDFVSQRTIFLSSIGVVLGIILSLYKLSYGMLQEVYTDIETVSDIMLDVMEHDIDNPSEQLKEGTMGILYSNFYKMVNALKDSRNRELSEKEFLRDIISDISHQLKTPLASLNIFVDLLLEEKVDDPEKKKQILLEASNQLNRMEWMVLSMLKLARIEAGAIQFAKEPTYLKVLFIQAAQSVQFLLGERNQNLHINCDKDASFLLDAGWLTEALINLLKNASDYSGEGSQIWLKLEQTSVYTRIYVKDEGPGIPEAELPNIFKRFYRVNQEVNPNSVGIGLSLTKSIVVGMGGSIRVESKAVADGYSKEESYTKFIITFV